ncbi:MAG: hypothetical protein NUV52_03590 [Candidatus Roizmanbacteria bacterium]|nr:hypothetical protein [Candidatus Roizmanbacteria bacterium]
MATFEDGWLMVLGISLVFFELLMGVATGFDLFVLGWSFVAAGAVYMATADWQYGLLASLIVMVTYWFFLRNAIRRSLYLFFQRIGIDCLVGKEGTVVRKDRVLVEGELWQSNSAKPIKDDARIMVQAVVNNKLEVVAL